MNSKYCYYFIKNPFVVNKQTEMVHQGKCYINLKKNQ